MYQPDPLSNSAQEYLRSFHCILDNMICGMTEAGLTNSISYNFIVQMIPHHQAAIEMSRNILKYAANLPIRNTAAEIIEEQTKSIQNMLQIEHCCMSLYNCHHKVCMYQTQVDRILHTMFAEMRNAPSTSQLDISFMKGMIPHHEGAVRLSKNALQYDVCLELRPILNAMITSQEQGIARMKELLRCCC